MARMPKYSLDDAPTGSRDGFDAVAERYGNDLRRHRARPPAGTASGMTAYHTFRECHQDTIGSGR
jgi:hypothetical protein